MGVILSAALVGYGCYLALLIELRRSDAPGLVADDRGLTLRGVAYDYPLIPWGEIRGMYRTEVNYFTESLALQVPQPQRFATPNLPPRLFRLHRWLRGNRGDKYRIVVPAELLDAENRALVEGLLNIYYMHRSSVSNAPA